MVGPPDHCRLSFHKGWLPLAKSIKQYDADPLVYSGGATREQLKQTNNEDVHSPAGARARGPLAKSIQSCGNSDPLLYGSTLPADNSEKPDSKNNTGSQKNQREEITTEDLIALFRSKASWSAVLDDPELAPICYSEYPAHRYLFEAFKRQDRLPCLGPLIPK